MKSKSTLKANSIRSVWRNPIHFVAFGFGTGVLPRMPGTYGTLAAIPIYLLMMNLPLWIYALFTIILIVFAVIACDITAKDIGVHDYSGIVLDEIVGFLVTMIAVPIGWFWIALGFILFRIFDIWKPWPIKWLDRKVSGGFGIVVDDLLAGVYAWIVLQIIAAALMHYE